MTSDILIDKEYKIGFHIGVLSEIPFGDKFSLQAEILYSIYGSKGKEIMLGGPPITTEYKFDYIQIPILAKIYLYKGFIGNFRYTHSLTNVLDQNYSETKNYGFLMGIGYLF